MSGKSRKTKVVAIRLPNEIYDILQRRVNGSRSRWDSIGSYLQERIIYDAIRKHINHTKPRKTEIMEENARE